MARLEVLDVVRAFLDLDSADHAVAGDRVQDRVVQGWRLEDTVRARPEDRRGRRLQHHSVGRHEDRLVGAALLGDPGGVHVGGVAQRLDAVQDHRRLIGDRRDGCRVRVGEGLLDQQDATAAAGDDYTQVRLDLAGFGEEGRELGLERRAVDGQVDRGGRALEAVPVLVHRERAARVEPGDLEHAVTAVEAVVGQGEGCLARGGDLAVHARERRLLPSGPCGTGRYRNPQPTLVSQPRVSNGVRPH